MSIRSHRKSRRVRKASNSYTLFSGDFTLYDHVLDHSVLFGVVPKKYTEAKLSHLDLTFAMGRGRQRDGVDGKLSLACL